MALIVKLHPTKLRTTMDYSVIHLIRFEDKQERAMKVFRAVLKTSQNYVIGITCDQRPHNKKKYQEQADDRNQRSFVQKVKLV